MLLQEAPETYQVTLVLQLALRSSMYPLVQLLLEIAVLEIPEAGVLGGPEDNLLESTI